jgi:fumarate hydratase subunit beta
MVQVSLVKKIVAPLSKEAVASLRAGDLVELSGTIYAARDAAHARMAKLLDTGQALPFELKGNVIYYMGPSPAKPGQVIGSAGPTTSGRMDGYTPRLLELGLSGMIGKGKRSPAVLQAMQEYQAVYFAAIGGAGALLASHIRSEKIIAFADLGPEAIRELVVENFPVIVAGDVYGGNLYESEVEKYKSG